LRVPAGPLARRESIDQVPDGWAVYLIGKRGHRRYYHTVDKAGARELLQRHHADNGAPYANAALERSRAVLGNRLIHSRPHAPEGRGKLERPHSRSGVDPPSERSPIPDHFQQSDQSRSEGPLRRNGHPGDSELLAVLAAVVELKIFAKLPA
jgi:transposase InsO family protein